jgi:hypothetical protein
MKMSEDDPFRNSDPGWTWTLKKTPEMKFFKRDKCEIYSEGDKIFVKLCVNHPLVEYIHSWNLLQNVAEPFKEDEGS